MVKEKVTRRKKQPEKPSKTIRESSGMGNVSREAKRSKFEEEGSRQRQRADEEEEKTEGRGLVDLLG